MKRRLFGPRPIALSSHAAAISCGGGQILEVRSYGRSAPAKCAGIHVFVTAVVNMVH